MKEVIQIRDLSKNYGSLTAVDGISLSVHEGSLFAFLGPNGAGKSTTVNILCTLLEKSGGEAVVDGFRIGEEDEKVRGSIGVVFQDNVLDEYLTVEENLLSRGGLYGMRGGELTERVRRVADILGISDLLKRRYGKLSGGQRRRSEIGRALMSDPRILFLDEPTTGLDPQTRIVVWETLRRLQRELGMTIFLTTHYMEEADAADWVAIIDHGTIVAEGTPFDLKRQYSRDALYLYPAEEHKAPLVQWLEEQNAELQPANGGIRVTVDNSLAALEILKQREGDYKAFQVVDGSMDDVFVRITGHQIREDNE